MTTRNVLIVDGYSTGRFFPKLLRKRGLVPYHLTSGMERKSSLPADMLAKYIKSQIGDDYEQTFQMPERLEDILPVLEKLDFAAILPGTESGVDTAEHLADHFGLLVNVVGGANVRRNKYLMQKAVEKAGLRSISSVFAENIAQAMTWYALHPGAAVVKPVQSAGTDGVSICQNAQELEKALQGLFGTRDAYGNVNDRVLVQEYVEGPEIVVNCVSRHGQHILTDLVDYNKIRINDSAPIYDAMFLRREIDEEHQKAVEYTFQVLDALGIRYGATHTELILTPTGPVLVETGARLMGLINDAYHDALGYNLADWVLDSYLSDSAHKRNAKRGYKPRKSCLMKLFISHREGNLAGLPILDALKHFPTAHNPVFDHTLQTMQLHKTVNMVTRPGECTLLDKNEENVLRDYQLARYIETCADRLFYQTTQDDKLSAREEALFKSLAAGVFPQQEVDRFFHGYAMAYKDYKNSNLYVLNENMQPCLPGETGDIYVAGAYLTKKYQTMAQIDASRMVPNPFYSTVLDNGVFPLMYHTQDRAFINADGEVEFVDAKTGLKTSSFGAFDGRQSWPLTYAERQMAAEQQMSNESSAYNARFLFKLTGALDVARLREALQLWVERHRIFSSYYPFENGHFVHKIQRKKSISLTSYECAEEELPALLEKINTPFNIRRAPLHRFALVRTGPNTHYFVIHMHHIIIDGIGMISVIEELWKLYKNKRAKRFKLEAQDYLDYAVWENEHDDPEQKKEFFLKLFADGVPENEMPCRALRPEELPPTSDVSRDWLLNAAEVDALAKKLHISTAGLLLGVLGMTLGKYCNSEDVAIGAVMNGRSHPQTKEMVGMFVNAVPLRFKPAGDLALGEYLQQVRACLKGAILNQTCPFESLVPILAPQRTLARKPVFDVIFNYRGEIRKFETEGLSIDSVQVRQATPIDMQFEVLRRQQGLSLSVCYSKQLYHEDIVEGFLELYTKILKEMARQNASLSKLAELTELPSSQKEKLLGDFAGERTPVALDDTIIRQFGRMAARFAAKTALQFEDHAFTYAQLDGFSDALARKLLARGIGAGKRVALLCKRSHRMPLCMLGILKARAAYVPLDPTHPAERLEFMLQDSGAELVIADKELLGVLKQSAVPVWCSDDLLTSVPFKPEPMPLSEPVKEDDVVVLYTSGTTGKPKGVPLTHANLAAFCDWLGKQLGGVDETDNLACCASFGFDASLLDIFLALTRGGCLHIISEDLRIDLASLNDYFHRHHITRTMLTTQLGRQFVKNMKNHSLKSFIVGGETLVPVQPPQGYTLFNCYGPTETTVCVTAFAVTRFCDPVPLGKPSDNTCIYIVDKRGRLCPVGTAGELCIAGYQVARGYLNRPELTGEKFTPNPFSREPGFELIYKTGDVARYTPSGLLEFCGRRDSQVKIRGFRIELTEIEACLRKHAQVKDATVIARDAAGGGKYVAAYYVAEDTLEPEELRHFMEDELPPYMIPATLTRLDSIPLNPSGKVDHRRLPDPSAGMAQQKQYSEPKGRVEKELVSIWGELLNMDANKIGRDDSFFDIGGNSLRSTELSLRIREVFGENVSPAAIFKRPTIKEQAKLLLSKNRFPLIHPFCEEGNKTPIFFVHTANTGAEAYVPLAGKMPGDQPFYAVEPHNIFSEEGVIRGVENMARRYIEYIRNVRAHGPYILGGWSFGAVLAYEIAVQLRAMGEVVEHVYLIDPVIERCAEQQALERKLIRTAYFQGYLQNDPLFGRFKKMGLIDKLVQNSENVMEDLFAFKPKPFDGSVTLFKATKSAPVTRDVDREHANLIRKFQKEQLGRKYNGFDKYVKHLDTVRINAIHDYLMRGTALEAVARKMRERHR